MKKKSKTKKKDKRGILIVAIFTVAILAYVIITTTQDKMTFRFMGTDWKEGVYDGENIFHAEFQTKNGTEELYLRNDPRQNYVNINGTVEKLKKKVYVSLSKEVEDCMLKTPKIKDNIEGFLLGPMERENVVFTTTDADWALKTNNTEEYKTCTNSYKESVIVLEMGEGKVSVHPANDLCYVVQMKDCNDMKSIERLMLELIANK